MAGSVKDLSKYRFERCSEELENSKILLDALKFKLSLNRSYYSIFHGMREHADYEDFFVASRQDAEEQYLKAKKFHSLISEYLKSLQIL